jgi:pimeloyl-ACP methyl ester carboxylesterase
VAQDERVSVRVLLLLVFGVVLAMTAGGVNAHAVKPPEQPRTGPGGAEYSHREVRESVHGKGGEQFWLFQPAAPACEKAPLILFLHGYSAMEPHGYRGWIDHLVRRGNIVVYPRYQATLLTPAVDFHTNTLAAMKAALALLKEKGNTEPDLGNFAAVGHSAGGVGAVNYAAGAREAGLPEPKAVVVVQPGQGPRRGVPLVPLLLEKGLPAAPVTTEMELPGSRLNMAGDERESGDGPQAKGACWHCAGRTGGAR